ncbi:hypothetical protein [Pseudomonas syringae]|uniref:hypothetical protein n=1 Tax=Pseudomonas syringae TaxID=317 RepID=UPI001CA83ACD|nr:hypothetical protein [Pseudomonas syringae]
MIALTVRDPARKALTLGVDGKVQTPTSRCSGLNNRVTPQRLGGVAVLVEALDMIDHLVRK